MVIRLKYNEAAAILYTCLVPFVFLLGIIIPSGISRRMVVGIIIWALLLISISRDGKGKVLDSFILLVVVGLIFGISYFAHPEYHELYSDRVFQYIIAGVTGISGYFVMRQLSELQSLRKVLKTTAYILFFYYFIRSFDVIIHGYWSTFSIGTATNTFSNNSMEFGYSMLFPSLLFLAFYYIDKKMFYLLFSIMGAVEIMLFGGRGPLFAYICFISLYFVFVWLKDHEVKHKWLKIFGIILGVSILYSSFNSIMQVISNMLSSHGIQSRFFVLFTSGKIADDNGRAWIQTRVINLINQKSVFSGYGPLADSYYVGYYSHNIVLELALEFGIVFGGMIIVLILVEMLRLLITCKDEEFCILFLVFVACGFIKLFFSSTFWQESLFWMMLAMMFNFRKYKYGTNTDE